MTPRRLFVLNAVIAGFYGIALLAVTDPILDIYGIDANAIVAGAQAIAPGRPIRHLKALP